MPANIRDDGGKKIKGHKRHILVDIMGNPLHVEVHATNISATKAASNVLAKAFEKIPFDQSIFW